MCTMFSRRVIRTFLLSSSGLTLFRRQHMEAGDELDGGEISVSWGLRGQGVAGVGVHRLLILAEGVHKHIRPRLHDCICA